MWTPGLSTALRTISSCHSALPMRHGLHPQAGCPHEHRMAASNTRTMCFLIWGCFCSASQAKIPRFTLSRVLFNVSLLQHSHPISQKMIGSAFTIYTTSNHLSPDPALPPCSQPSTSHLDYRSHLLTGLPASATIPPTAAWVIL